LLRKAGKLENTLVIMTGDHGMPFPRCKGNLYDSGARVPLAMLWPSVISPGLQVDSFVSLTDLAPTFLEAAGVTVPAAMTGRSLLETLTSGGTGRPEGAREYIITGKERHVPGQENADSGGTPMRAIRTEDYLYIRNFRPDRWPAGTPNWDKAFFPGSWYGDVDNGPTKSYMIDSKDKDDFHRRLFELAFAKRPEEELYDLRLDPGQLQNVAGNSTYSQIKNDLSNLLMEELRLSDDPRIQQQTPLFDTYPYYGGSPLKPGFEKQQTD
jgi:arylsulfatase A-like enzyme